MTLFCFLLLISVPQEPDRARSVVERIRFPAAEEVQRFRDQGPEYKAVLDIVLKRERWVEAVRFLEENLLPFGDEWNLTVSLEEWEGTSPAFGERKGVEGVIRFNMKRLGEYERKMIGLRKQDEELRKKGQRIEWKVPPLKYERLLHHELTHILQGGYSSPSWFHEGLASWAGADLNYVQAFLWTTEQVGDVEQPLTGEDVYGRGQLFLMWLESRLGRKAFGALARETIGKERDCKEVLSELVGVEWEKLRAEELVWARKYAKEHRPKK